MDNFVIGAFDCKITVGMEVCYPGRRGSSMWFNSGRVVELGEVVTPYNKDRNYFWIKIARDVGTGWSWRPKKPGKLVTLTNVRMVVPKPSV